MLYVKVLNNELEEPYENVLGYVICGEDGLVYSEDSISSIDDGQSFEKWIRMVGNPDYPSAHVIEY